MNNHVVGVNWNSRGGGLEAASRTRPRGTPGRGFGPAALGTPVDLGNFSLPMVRRDHRDRDLRLFFVSPEDERLGMDNGNVWVESMTRTLARLDALCTRRPGGAEGAGAHGCGPDAQAGTRAKFPGRDLLLISPRGSRPDVTVPAVAASSLM